MTFGTTNPGQVNSSQTNPITGRNRRAIGVFPNRHDAEHALHELRDSSFPMDRVSVIARDGDRQNDIAGAEVSDRVGNKADDGAKVGAVSGGALGGLTGLLVGLGALAIPGIGPVMLAGATATALATTLAGGAIGAVTGGLLGALVGLGIPEERARVYNDRVARGDYLVMVEGSDQDIARAEAILHHRGIEEYGVYDAPDATTVATTAPTPYPQPTSRTAVNLGDTLGSDLRRRAIGFFSHRRDAEAAVQELRTSGFPLGQISLVAQNLERQGTFADIDVRDRIDDNPFGVVAERLNFLRNRLTRGDYLVSVRGTEAEIQQAAAILNRHSIQEFSTYDQSEFEADRSQGDRLLSDRTQRTQIDRSSGIDTPIDASSRSTVDDQPNIGIVDRRSEAR